MNVQPWELKRLRTIAIHAMTRLWLDPAVMPTESSQLVKQRLLNFVNHFQLFWQLPSACPGDALNALRVALNDPNGVLQS